MTKHVKLDTRPARAKLKPRGAPYWTKIGADLWLGYRRVKAGPGSWVRRHYLGDGKYAFDAFANEDDLEFDQAGERARERAQADLEGERIAKLGPPLTARRAFDEYALAREGRYDQHALAGTRSGARTRLARVLAANPAFAQAPLAAVTVRMLAGLAIDDRTKHDVRAALRKAASAYRDQLPASVRDIIRDGLAGSPAPARRPRDAQVGLPGADIKRIAAAAWEVDAEMGFDGGLARLILVLAATGARFSQAVRMRVADVQVAQSRLMIPTSRKGRLVKSASYTAVPVAADVLDALAPAVNGRVGTAPLLVRPVWRRLAGPISWERTAELRPWKNVGDLARPWKAIVDRAGLAPGVTPYALRHSSIARALRLGLPVQLTARLHDTSAAMIEANYTALIVSLLDELAQRAVISLAPATVTPLSAVRG